MIVVFFVVVFGFVFSLAGTGPVRKVYVPDPARIAISLHCNWNQYLLIPFIISRFHL